MSQLDQYRVRPPKVRPPMDAEIDDTTGHIRPPADGAETPVRPPVRPPVAGDDTTGHIRPPADGGETPVRPPVRPPADGEDDVVAHIVKP